ncbi:MAG: hypothetical protein HY423_03200 [Candidatus Lambdaproteobacteria bacterium]|nr:hypothetical protein [Candidatus Lambdaproteobacteria bacterium]
MAVPDQFPRLRLLRLDSIRFHERPERPRTLKLVERIRQDAMLRNPPIAAELGEGQHLLLDGANRVSALGELGYSHVPAQVVDYGDERIQLKGWHHLLIDGRTLRLKAIYGALEGVALREVPTAELARLLELRRVHAVLVDERAACWAIFPERHEGRIDVRERVRVQAQLVAAYEGQSGIERIKLAEFSRLPEVIRSVEHQLVLFPVMTKDELLELAIDNLMIPTGLTRHLIPGRALGLNMDLAFIRGLQTDQEKERHFQAYVERLEMGGRTRFYEESVFVMNE